MYNAIPDPAKYNMCIASSQGLTLKPENLIVSAGCGAIVNDLLYCITSTGEGVALPAPYYPAFDYDIKVRCHAMLFSSEMPALQMLQNSNACKLSPVFWASLLSKGAAPLVQCIVPQMYYKHHHSPCAHSIPRSQLCFNPKYKAASRAMPHMCLAQPVITVKT